jgi:hypothetical protein
MPQIQSGIQRHTPSKGERGTPRGNERDIPLALALPADTVRDRTPAFQRGNSRPARARRGVLPFGPGQHPAEVQSRSIWLAKANGAGAFPGSVKSLCTPAPPSHSLTAQREVAVEIESTLDFPKNRLKTYLTRPYHVPNPDA